MKYTLQVLTVLVWFFLFNGISLASSGIKLYEKILWNYFETINSFGPRYSGSDGNEKLQNFLVKEGNKLADSTRRQEFYHRPESGLSVPMSNIEFRFQGRNNDLQPILFGAHYDTRPYADEDENPQYVARPILGANDGGSGTALLLGLAHYFSKNKQEQPVLLVFFDGEDFGAKRSADYMLGSKYYAKSLNSIKKSRWPAWVAVFDMIADKQLEIYKERNSLRSAPWLVDTFHNVSKKVKGGDSFIDDTRFSILDDHYPFILLNIPSILLIDMDYPYWHTQNDTVDKCSPKSLFTVFNVTVETLKELKRLKL